jgi:uncharacterized protein YdaU (DUF1376 family)
MSNAWGAFYWGDYIADTGHLTLAQHGAYLLLMAHYYRTRRPLPANAPVLHRVCRCTTDVDRCAVDEVLQEFFTLDGDVYRQNRIDRELAKAIDISEKRSTAARAKHEKSRGPSARANAVQVHTQPQPQSQPQLERKPSAANASVADDESEPIISDQHPAEIIPPRTPEGINFHASPIIETRDGLHSGREGEAKERPRTDQVPPLIIPPNQTLSVDETPDGLHPNQYAARLLEEINFLPVPNMISAVTAAIDYEAKTMDVMSAYEFVLEGTRYAMFEECEINPVFFTDRQYRPEWNNGNERQVSTQARPTGNTQRTIIPAARVSAADTNRSNPIETQLEQLYKLYPRKREKLEAKKAIRKAVGVVMAGDPDHPAMPLEDALNYIAERITLYARYVQGCDPKYIPYPASWFNAGSFWDDERDWRSKQNRTSDSNGATKLPPSYVPASERIRQERDVKARGAQ